MTLNIKTPRTDSRGSPRADDKPRKLVAAVVNELSAWGPRDFISALHRWQQGSVSLIHLNVLLLLEGGGPLSMSRLAEALDISVASATGVVDRMEARGLVERRHDTADRRVVLVVAAPGAKAMLGDIDKRRREGLAKLLARLSDEELTGLLAGHRALRAAREHFMRSFNAPSPGAATAPEAGTTRDETSS